MCQDSTAQEVLCRFQNNAAQADWKTHLLATPCEATQHEAVLCDGPHADGNLVCCS